MAAGPFPGLRPFEEEDAEVFFGREDQIHEALSRLRQTRFLAVLGDSGCGKSSLVRAGIIPALRDGFLADREDGWKIAVMRPGGSPLSSLAEALAAPDVCNLNDAQALALRVAMRRSRFALGSLAIECGWPKGTSLLVFVDQFEELFRFGRERSDRTIDEESRQFVRLILSAADDTDVPIYILLTMRPEFLGRCGPYVGLPDAINSGIFLVPHLNRDEVRDVILEPIRAYGATIKVRLVNRILDDLGERPDQLPVLQHALLRLWSVATEKQPGDALALDEELYDAPRIGGLQNALPRHLEEILAGFDEERRRIAEVLFRNLTAVADNDELVRRPAPLGEVVPLTGSDFAAVSQLVESFRAEGRSFLTPPAPAKLEPHTVIDLSHESLIRQWNRLATWTRDEHISRQVRQHLTSKSEHWEQVGRQAANEEDYLLQGLDLARAIEWRKNHQAEINDASRKREREYLDRSESMREDAVKLRAANTHLRGALAGILILTAFVGAFASYSLRMEQQAVAYSRRFERAANAERLASESQRLTDNLAVRRALLAVESIRASVVHRNGQLTGDAPRTNALKAFQDAVAMITPPGIHTRVLGSHKGAANCLAISRDGRWLVTGGDDCTVRIWSVDARADSPPRVITGYPSPVTRVDVSRDDRWLVVGSANGEVFVHDFRSLPATCPAKTFAQVKGRVTDIEFARNGEWFAISSYFVGEFGSNESPHTVVWRWDANSESFCEKGLALRGHYGPVSDIVAFELAPAPGQRASQWLATGGSDIIVLFWRLDAEAFDEKNNQDSSVAPVCQLFLGVFASDLAVSELIRQMTIDTPHIKDRFLIPQPGRSCRSMKPTSLSRILK